MRMYFYAKPDRSKKERWEILNDSKETQNAVTQNGYMFRSALSISEPIISEEDIEDPSKIKYQGDLYFDIDSGEIAESISMLQDLIKKLESYDVVDYQVYATGSKGFHLIVPAKHFSEGKPCSYLAYVYGDMANRMGLSYLDFSIYSAQKGNMLRLPNVLRRRDQKYTYKVEVPAELVGALTPLGVRILVSSPRPLTREISSGSTIGIRKGTRKALKLQALFNESKKLIVETRKKYVSLKVELIPELRELKEVPGCIQKLSRYEVRDEAVFNKKALVLMAFLEASGLPKETKKSLIDDLAQHGKSATYRDARSRKEHILSLQRQGKFALGFLFKEIEPCGGCLLCDGSLNKGPSRMKDPAESFEVEDQYAETLEKMQGYRVLDSSVGVEGYNFVLSQGSEKPTKKLTSFLMVLENVAVSLDDPSEGLIRVGAIFSMHYTHERKHRMFSLFIPEESWNSCTSFKLVLGGRGNLAFLGNDSDLVQLKHYLMSSETSKMTVVQTAAFGIRHMHIPKQDEPSGVQEVLAYVEPGYALQVPLVEEGGSPQYQFNRLEYTGSPAQQGDLTPRLMAAQQVGREHNDVVIDALQTFLSAGYPATQGIVLGWFVACLFKPHFLKWERSWPLLGITGQVGSGKSSLMALAGSLHGLHCEGGGVNNLMDAPASTKVAIRNALENSTSTAVLVDEFTNNKMKREMHLDKATMLQLTYNMSSATRSDTSGKGRRRNYSATVNACVCFTAETIPSGSELEAFVNRTLFVEYTMAHRELPGVSDAYRKFISNDFGSVFRSIGKTATLYALGKPLGFVKAFHEEALSLLPNKMKEVPNTGRLSHAYCVALSGLRLLQTTLKDVADIDISAIIEPVYSAVLRHIDDNTEEYIRKSFLNNPAVSLLNDVAALLEGLSRQDADNGTVPLIPEINFSITEERLLVSSSALFMTYNLAKNRTRMTNRGSVVTTLQSLEDVFLRETSCFLGIVEDPLVSQGHMPCIALDVAKLKYMHVRVEAFTRYSRDYAMRQRRGPGSSLSDTTSNNFDAIFDSAGGVAR